MATEHGVWLAEALGPASLGPSALLGRYGTAQTVYEAREELEATGLITRAQCRQLLKYPLEKARELVEKHRAAGIGVAACDEDGYPGQLRGLEDMPAALYYKGDISVCGGGLLIAMIGSRRPSEYGVRAQKFLSEGLCRAGAILVSGLASGLDSEAHKAAVRAGTPTVAVIGTGPDLCYPAANKTLAELIEGCGVVLSEYPMGTPGAKQHFLQRNRLIAGLSRGVCVAEAARHSGTMSTIACADRYGRDVFAVPGSIFSPLSAGVNALLATGAKPVCTPEDILKEYGVEEAPRTQPQPEEQAAPELTPLQARVCGLLTDAPKTLGELCAETGSAPPAKVLAALTSLELAGLARQLAGRRFQRTERMPEQTEKEDLEDE